MMKLTIESQTEDLVFRDVRNYSSLGRSITIPINQDYVGLMLKETFRGIPETATVTAEINGVTRTASVFVDTYPPYNPAIFTIDNNVFLLLGTSYKNTIVMDYDICSELEPPESIKFNLEIEEGNQFGHLIDPVTGAGTNSLTNLTNQEGEREFEFVADGITSVDDGTVVIKVTASDSRIEPWYVTYFIKSNKIKVVFEPESIMPGDTADVILKKIEPDGSIVDFEEDQRFDIKLIAGSEYGDIYIPQWEEITDEAWYVEQGFKFIASTEIDSMPVESVLKVNTSGGMAGSRLSGNESIKEEYRKINMANSIKNFEEQKRNTSGQNKTTIGDVSKYVMIGGPEEQLWGIGKILIGNSNDCSDAPRCDELISQEIIINKIETNECNNIKYFTEDGITLPYFYRFLEDFSIEACYSQIWERWQFHIRNSLNYSSVFCIREGKYKYIFNKSQVKEIPVSDCLVAEEDFFRLGTLSRKPGQYFIVEIALKHEEIHVEQLIELVSRIIEENNIYQRMSNYLLRCSDYNKKEEVENIARSYFRQNIIDNLISLVNKEWLLLNNFNNEQDIQDDPRIQEIVKQYVYELDCN